MAVARARELGERGLPLTAMALGALALAMVAPALVAGLEGDWRVARAFLQAGLFTLIVAGILGLAMARRMRRSAAVGEELATLVACWTVLPLFAALPLGLLTPWIGWQGAVFEMVAAITTTGGSAYGPAATVPEAVHLWRGLVGWLGGLLTLTAAWVVLAPRRLGGFEIEAATWRMQSADAPRDIALGIAAPPIGARLTRALRVILPTYTVLTGALALLLSGAGQSATSAAMHAMAVVSTSGIVIPGESFETQRNPVAELAVLVLMVVAASRLVYARASAFGPRRGLRRDPELWLMAGLVGLVSTTLFLRHWIGALTIDSDEPVAMLDAAWGTLFTVVSYMTTTGFVSGYWQEARQWSGLADPGLILLGLAAIGGGAATTAGGIKLIRAYALMRHGLREMERIAQPNSVVGVGARTRSLLREGPVIVWSFIMLFIFAVLASVLALTALGMSFETAIVAAIAALSNTGPAVQLVGGVAGGFADFSGAQRAVLAVAMLIGRIEILALIALFNPQSWRFDLAGAKKPAGSSHDATGSGW